VAWDRVWERAPAGDFNGDGFADLPGAPGNDCDPQEIRCGAVQVRIGGASAALTSRIVLSPAPNNNDLANADELYGSALAAGDFNGDGRDDLAVGIPRNYVQAGAAQVRAGSVQLHFGLPSALQPLQEIATYSFAENALGVLPGAPSSSEGFGQAVAFGDFNGDLKDDLAVGIPYDRSLCGTTPCAAGAVMVIDLDDSLLVHGYQMSLGRQGLPGNPVADDEYGWRVAAGDFNGDGMLTSRPASPARRCGCGAGGVRQRVLAPLWRPSAVESGELRRVARARGRLRQDVGRGRLQPRWLRRSGDGCPG
jgi:hypothetical protein